MDHIRPVAGDKAPDVNVFDSEGKVFVLPKTDKNVVLLLYRGHW